MGQTALNQDNLEEQPRIATAVDLARYDNHSLIGVLEGELGKNHDCYPLGDAEPTGINFYTFDPNSQQLQRVSYIDLATALSEKVDIDETASDLRELINQGPNLDILINSQRGKTIIRDLFDDLGEQVTSNGGKVSSYATAITESLASYLWLGATERYILPASLNMWHLPRMPQNLSVDEYERSIGRKKKKLQKEEFWEISERNNQRDLKFLTDFDFVMGHIQDPALRQGLIEEFCSGEDVRFLGSQLVELGLATKYETIGNMRNAFFDSIGARGRLEPLDEFWDRAGKNYSQIERTLATPRKSIPRELSIRHTQVKSQSRYERFVDGIDRVGGVAVATGIAVLMGLTFWYGAKFYSNQIEPNDDEVVAYTVGDNTKKQTFPEKVCATSDYVTVASGPQTLHYDLNGNVVEAVVARDIVGRRTVMIPSLDYRGLCRE